MTRDAESSTGITHNEGLICMRRRLFIHLFVWALLFGGGAWILLNPYAFSWVDLLITIAIGGGIFALSLAWPVVLILRSRAQPGCGTLISLPLLGVIGTLLALVVLGFTGYPRGGWTQLPSPPERAAEIVDSTIYMVFGDEVWVRAESGVLYGLGCGSNLSCEWEVRQELPPPSEESSRGYCGDAIQPHYHPPLKFGRALDTQATNYCGADYYIETHFRLMEDGTLWRWEIFSGMATLFLYLFAFGGGVVLALIASVFYGLVWRFMPRPSVREIPQEHEA